MKKLLIILMLFTAIHSYSQDAKHFSDLADEKIKQKDYKYALVLIDKAINLDKNDQWLYLKKAEIMFKLFGLVEAIGVLNESMKINPKFAEQYNRAGSYYQSSGDIDLSIMMYNEAIKFEPVDSIRYSYIMNRGTSKAHIRDFEGAKNDLEEALKFNPKDLAILNNLGPTYRELGMIDKAIECYKKATIIDSTFYGSVANLGFLYSSLDSLDLALYYFTKAIKMDPTEAIAYNNLGYIYYKKKDYNRALVEINKSLKMYSTNSYAYRNLGLVYLAQGNTKEACASLEYARKYGFTQQYGSEVDDLIKSNCTK